MASLPAVASNLEFPYSKSSSIGIVVYDLEHDEAVISENPSTMLTPASIVKCLTAAAVMSEGLEDYQYITQFKTVGEMTDTGELLGDIIISPSGDPSLGCDFSGEEVLTCIGNQLKRRGITKIVGGIEVDSLGLLEQGPVSTWEIADTKWSYGAGWFPLNFKENTQYGDKASLQPDEMFISSLESHLLSDSISVEWEAFEQDPIGIMDLYEVRSKPLRELLKTMMYRSQNLYAESFLRLLAPGQLRRNALEREIQILKSLGLDEDEFDLFDGSGLTRASKLSPYQMVILLRAMALNHGYVALFPHVGEDGTVKKLLAGTRLQGKLVLKSGSMRGVQTFAGYKLGNDGLPTHVVVIMVNNFKCKRSYVVKAIADFLLKLF